MLGFGEEEIEVVDKDKLSANLKIAALKFASHTQKNTCKLFEFKITTKSTTTS